MIQPHLFQSQLLQWFDQYGRHDLPWQQDKTPYRVWVSEIMLQQTQVTTVIPYYQRFMERFPDIKTLANADEDTVMHYWSGLGYYRRARYLHAAAKKIMSDFHGKFPDNLADLITLPGIGRSTAGAILSIAFQKQAAILDGNVKRVLTRLHGITDSIDEKTLWPLAEKYTPIHRTDHYAQAMMDLGATLCVRGKPRCEVCPFNKKCVAHTKDIAASLPIKKPRKSLPVHEATFLILRHKDLVLLEKRAPIGVWAGLWSLPQFEGHVTSKTLKA
ncbi:MAG TPA: A/G-specific adenine glycosylase, partial [Gammaproteobacteria bacterium]|nr:A/G-specific adenine glycosylase [Gammaproteobacteria bacterium]